jgi:ketosteroid isomerase-like protein
MMLAGLCALAGCLAGCGTSTRDDVQAKVQQFVTATAAKDAKTMCDQVLAPTLLERLAAGGITCQQAMQIFFSSVQSPTLSIGRIDVSGQTASAITLTSAHGQQGSLDAIKLVNTSHGWRISSLGSPVVPAAGATKGK